MEGFISAFNIDGGSDDHDDISILFAKPAFHTKGSSSNNPISVENYFEKDDEYLTLAIGTSLSSIQEISNETNEVDDVSLLYVKPVALQKQGSNKKNPILVEKYREDEDLQLAIMVSIQESSGLKSRNSKRATDGDDVQLLDSKPRKIFKGESSNSKPTANYDGGTNETVLKDGFIVGDDRTFLCDICVDEKPMSAIFRLIGCNHFYCSDCVAKYVASKLQENITNVRCPVMGCEGKLEPQHCSAILPRQVFDRWGDALCEAMILASERFYCPFKDCSALLINASDVGGVREAILESECPNCRRLFCAKCKVPWHAGVSCEEFHRNKDENSMEDIQLIKMAKRRKWQRCPNCRFFVQRSSGCLFMRCRCNFTFCYNCGAEMKSHHCNNCKR